jgi:hypothetical protein
MRPIASSPTNGVVRSEFAVADDLLGTGQGRASGRVVGALYEARCAGEPCLRERDLVGVVRDLAGDEAEHLAPPLVYAEQPWRACEAHVLKVPQQRVNVSRVGMKRPPHRLVHPHHARSAPTTAERGLTLTAHGRHAAILVPPLPRVHCHTALRRRGRVRHSA